MKLEATSRERVKRGADAPVERQKAAGLAGCRSGHFGPLHDSDVNPAATKEIGGAGADNSTAADHNVHGCFADPGAGRSEGGTACGPQFLGYGYHKFSGKLSGGNVNSAPPLPPFQ